MQLITSYLRLPDNFERLQAWMPSDSRLKIAVLFGDDKTDKKFKRLTIQEIWQAIQIVKKDDAHHFMKISVVADDLLPLRTACEDFACI